MRTTFLTAFALILGFGLGWVSRPAGRAPAPNGAKPAAPFPPTGTPATPLPVPSPTAATPPAAVQDTGSTYRNRAETVRWLRQSGAPIYFQVLAGDTFSPAFGKIMELAPDQMARLNDVALETKLKLGAARQAVASSHTSEDGKSLLVDIPTVDVSTSRAAFDHLLETLKSTLGPERFEMFNELGGAGFENSFDQFGLTPLRYELVLQPITPVPNAEPHYQYKRHILNPKGHSIGMSGSTVNITLMEKHDPILARFLQAKLSATVGK